jgi:hypothetical protein
VALFISYRAAQELRSRRTAAIGRMPDTSASARQALTRLSQGRVANSGDPGGPLGRLEPADQTDVDHD